MVKSMANVTTIICHQKQSSHTYRWKIRCEWHHVKPDSIWYVNDCDTHNIKANNFMLSHLMRAPCRSTYTHLDAFRTKLVLLRFHVLFQIKLTIFEAQIELIVVRHIEDIFQPECGEGAHGVRTTCV